MSAVQNDPVTGGLQCFIWILSAIQWKNSIGILKMATNRKNFLNVSMRSWFYKPFLFVLYIYKVGHQE